MITFYNTNYNEFDPTKNGGGMVRAINNDLKHELIKRVRPNTAENGGIRWFKFFIRPKTKVLNVGVNLIKFTDSPTEEVYLSDSVANFESELDNPRLFGVFEVVDVDDEIIIADDGSDKDTQILLVKIAETSYGPVFLVGDKHL